MCTTSAVGSYSADSSQPEALSSSSHCSGLTVKLSTYRTDKSTVARIRTEKNENLDRPCKRIIGHQPCKLYCMHDILSIRLSQTLPYVRYSESLVHAHGGRIKEDMTKGEKFQIHVFFDHHDQDFSHFERIPVKSERRYSQRATLKRRLSFFMHPP